jgi:hypothetical protein
MAFTGKLAKNLLLVAPIDWARLAAYIDGEGCISIKSVKGNRAASRRVLYVDVSVTNTDFRLTAWLQVTFGGSVYINHGNRGNEKWSPAAQWNIASKYAAAILEYCLPYFIIKREQAEVALAFQSTILPGRPYGVKGRPDDLISKQYGFKEQLQDLKGTSSRARRSVPPSTIQ